MGRPDAAVTLIFGVMPGPHPLSDLLCLKNDPPWHCRSYRDHPIRNPFSASLLSSVVRSGPSHRSQSVQGTDRQPSMRILIADDNVWIRRGVMSILAPVPDWVVCGEAKDGTEAVQRAAELLPDLVLLDVSMPGLNGLDVARLLRAKVPATKILIMSQHDPAFLTSRALEAGADACVDKNHLSTELLPVIASVTKAVDSHLSPAQ